MLLERISVRVSIKTHKQLSQLAKADKRDLSDYVRILLESVLEKHNEESQGKDSQEVHPQN